MPRDELAEVVWGADLPRSWEQLLRGLASKLRDFLGAAGLDPTRVLTSVLGVYQLHLPADVTVDVEDASVALDLAVAALATGDADRAFEAASAALSVASGQFLPGVSGAWVEHRQGELRELRLRALEALAGAEEAEGRWSRAVAATEEVIGLEPFRESAYLRLMAAHTGAGSRGEALRAYERCRRVLADELGVNPSAATEAAYLALLGDEPSDPVVAADLAPLPLPLALAVGPSAFLVGREEPTARLARAFERAVTDGRQAVLVAGEPGIGKTALVAYLARSAHAKGARVLYGRCDEDLGVANQPFAEALGHCVAHCPLAELAAHAAAHGGELGRLVPELGRRLPGLPASLATDPEADRYRLFESVAAILAAASEVAPVMVVLDDLHWATNATLLLLRHLLRSAVPAEAVLVIGTYRHSELGASHPLAATLADLRREPEGMTRVKLDGLDEDGVAAFVRAAECAPPGEEEAALARALHAHTAGNPFFVGQLLAHLDETGAVYRREGQWSLYTDAEGLAVPEGVKEVVARRMHRLSEAANRALVLASVIGAEFDLELVEAVTDQPDDHILDAIEEALTGQLVTEVGHGRYRFAHALVRDTIYANLTTTRRGRLHRRIGEALESVAGQDDIARLPALARHFAAAASAGCALKAADYALAAARQAVAQAAWEDAAALLERGLEALGADGPPNLARRCDLLLLLAESWTRFYDPPRAMSAAIPAVAAARALGSPEKLGWAAYWYVRAAAGGYRRPDPANVRAAGKALAEAILALGDTLPALQARLLAMLARIQDAAPETSKVTREEALALARRAGDPEALGVVLAECSTALRGSLHPHEPEEGWIAEREELVLHYVEDWAPVLREFHRVLKEDGAAIFSTHHPTMDWQLHSPDDYFAVKQVTEVWSRGSKRFEVTFWRRPLTAMTQAIASAGFVIQRLVEPEALPELQDRDPDAYDKIRRAPRFLFFRITPG